MIELRLPRAVEAHPAASRFAGELQARSAPLWTDGETNAVCCTLTPRVALCLENARDAGHLARGLEGAARELAAEDRGLRKVDRRTNVVRGGRVSRVLVLANDGAERFYRNVDKLVREHRPRVLALRTTSDQEALAASIFGPGQLVRALLLTHKDAVSELLLALADDWTGTPADG